MNVLLIAVVVMLIVLRVDIVQRRAVAFVRILSIK